LSLFHDIGTADGSTGLPEPVLLSEVQAP